MRYQVFIVIMFALVKPMKLLCPSPYLQWGSGCYYITLQTRVTWHQAFFNCGLDMKGYLAEVESEQEHNDLAALIKRADPNSEYAYWIGAADIQQEGQYRWMTSGKPVIYTPWASGEPNNDGDGDCVHMEENIYKWNDETCESPTNAGVPMKGICEIDPIEWPFPIGNN